MSADLAARYGNYTYDTGGAQPDSWVIDDSSTNPVTSVPRSSIARDGIGYMEPRRVSIRGVIAIDGGGSTDTLRDMVRAFRSAHPRGITKQLYLDSDCYLNAKVIRANDTWDASQSNQMVTYSVDFVCPDPYWYNASAETTNTWSTPTNGATRSITNGGLETAQPKFTFTFGSTAALNITLYNDTLSADNFFRLSSGGVNLASGDIVEVDTYLQTVRYKPSAGSFGYKHSWLVPGSDNYFGLAPGANTLRLVIVTSPTISSIATNFTKRWL